MQKSWLSGCSRLTNRLNTLIKALSPPTSRTLDWHSAEFTELQGQMFWQLTDIPPTVDRYITDIWPIVSRGASSKYQPILGRWSISLSTDYRPTIDRLSTDHRPTIDRLSTDYRPTVNRLSTDYRPTIDRLSTAIWTDIYSKQDPGFSIPNPRKNVCKVKYAIHMEIQHWGTDRRLRKEEQTCFIESFQTFLKEIHLEISSLVYGLYFCFESHLIKFIYW